MGFLYVLIIGIGTALTTIIILMKIPKEMRRKILGYDIYIDVLMGCVFGAALIGTFSGTASAVLACLAFSIALYGIKKSTGAEMWLKRNKRAGFFSARHWVAV